MVSNGQPVTPSPKAPEVTVQIGGLSYKLCFNWGFFLAYEELTGLNSFANPFDKPDARRITSILVAALRKYHPDVTADDLRDNLTYAEVMKMAQVLAESWAKALPQQPTDEKKTSDDAVVEAQPTPQPA